jgi:ribosomal protein S18 acetylase RimI-like enzyme
MFSSGKFVTLKNGSRVLIRYLNNGDLTDIIRFIRNAPLEDSHFLTYFSANPRHLDAFLDHHVCSQNLPLLALEIDQGRIIGAVFFSRGQGGIGHIGEVHCIFVSRPFQRMGLGSMLLDECLRSMRLSQGLTACPAKVSRFPCGAPRS